MSLEQGNVIATRFLSPYLQFKDSVSISFVAKDNSSFAINVTGGEPKPDTTLIPCSIVLSKTPLENYKTIGRVVTDKELNRSYATGACRIIANSLNDKLKILNVLENLHKCLTESES